MEVYRNPSSSPLLQLLVRTPLAPPNLRSKHQTSNKWTVHLLDAFAHCLIRWPRETIAVGLTADRSTLTASCQQSKSTEPINWLYEEAELEKTLSENLVATKNSAGRKGTKSEKQENPSLYCNLVNECTRAEQLAFHVLKYCSIPKEEYERQ